MYSKRKNCFKQLILNIIKIETVKNNCLKRKNEKNMIKGKMRIKNK